jgi:hypothetical protein
MVIFWDTSAVVPLLVKESTSLPLRSWLVFRRSWSGGARRSSASPPLPGGKATRRSRLRLPIRPADD